MMTLPAPRRAPAPQPEARPRSRDHLRVLERPVRNRRGLGFLGMIATIVVFVTLLALAAFQAIVVQNQQRIDRLDRNLTTAQGQYERLRLEVAQLESPERIVDAAVNRLGMVLPPGTTYLLPDPQAAAGASTGTGAGAAAATSGSASDGHDSRGRSTLAAGSSTKSTDSWSEVKPFLGEGP